MSKEELAAINEWFNAVQKTQPPGSLALLFYVRDGHILLGRGSVPVEMKLFDLRNIPQCIELASEVLWSIHENGVPQQEPAAAPPSKE